MKNSRKILIIIITLAIIISTLSGSVSKMVTINASVITRTPVKVAVIVYDTDLYISEIINNLKDIQKENEGNVEFTFFSCNKDQNIQNQITFKTSNLPAVHIVLAIVP